MRGLVQSGGTGAPLAQINGQSMAGYAYTVIMRLGRLEATQSSASLAFSSSPEKETDQWVILTSDTTPRERRPEL